MDQEAVLFANEAFYQAFAARDLAAMDSLWATAQPVACIHPGWGALDGRAAVMASWRDILTNPNAPVITCQQAKAYVHGDTAFVVCFEEIGGNFLIATNIFVRRGQVWKMIHHQAGATAAKPAEAEEAEPPARPN